jgi:hypothetical protein
MSTATTIYDLSNAVWTPVTGPSVAPQVPEGYRPINEPDGVRFYIIGALPYAGWLAKHSVPLLPIAAPFGVTLNFNLNPDDAAALKGQAWEFDLMYSDQNGNVGNGSGQLNIAEGGKWQIVVGGAWVDVPGFTPIIPPPNVITPVQVKYIFDPVKEITSVTQVMVGTSSATVPVSMQNQPFIKMTPPWGLNLLIAQVQQDVIATGGAYSFKIATGNTITVSWP